MQERVLLSERKNDESEINREKNSPEFVFCQKLVVISEFQFMN